LFSLDDIARATFHSVIKRPKAKISIPRDSSALRQEIETIFREKHSSIEFTFVEGDVDFACRILETDDFEGPALWETIRTELKRIERKYR
jgi:hypothetical protein